MVAMPVDELQAFPDQHFPVTPALRRPQPRDMIAETRLLKLGKRLAVGEVGLIDPEYPAEYQISLDGSELHSVSTVTPNAEETNMNWDIVKGNWKQMKGQVQSHWGKLTNDDLDVIEGNRDQLAGRIQEQYGVSKDEAEEQIRDFEKEQDR